MSRQARTSPAALWLRVLVGAAFAVSGAAALIDEVAWMRWLTLSVGSSTQASLVVLGSFMGGLGLGSWLAGSVGDRRPRAGLALFAALEAAIGLWTLVSIPLLGSWLPEWTAALARQAGVETLPYTLRALIATALLVVPTVMMGATLPLLTRWALAVGGLPGRDVGVLYTLNTLGGTCGALLAAFVLIERLGLARSVLLAGCTDLVIAAAAGLLAWRASMPHEETARERKRNRKKEKSRRRDESPAATAGTALDAPAPLLAAIFGFTASGFVGLALEVTSHRIIAILAGSTSYAFSVMLGAFLLGISLGSFAGAWIADRARSPGAMLALTLGGLAAGTGFARYIFDAGWWQLAGRVARAVPGLAGWSYGLEMAGCLLALLPATLMLGLAVPLVGRLAAAAPERFAHRFGLAYALNTAGAVAGVVVGGLVLVPLLGTAGSLLLLVIVATLAGLVVVMLGTAGVRRPRTAAAVIVLGAGGLLLGAGADPVRDALGERAGTNEMLEIVEGPVQTIAVVREFNDQQLEFLRLLTNKTSLTGTHLYAQRYMRLLGHLPVLWAEDPQRALVICLGTGMTAAAVASHPEIERIDVAEISPEVRDVAHYFSAANDDVLEDPRVRLLVEDGRHVLLVASEPWDLVTLEPPPPRDSGVVSLYTTDFYRLVGERLAEGGTLAQWIPLHSQSMQEVRMLLRSFLEVYPHVLGFMPVERDLILIGSFSPLEVDPQKLEARIAAPAVRRSLGSIGMLGAEDLLAAALIDREGLARIAGDAPLVTDDHPLVEHFARFGKSPRLPPAEPFAENPPTLEELISTSADDSLMARFADARRAQLSINRAAWAAERGDMNAWRRLSLEAARERPEDRYVMWAAQISDGHVAHLRARAEASAGAAAPWRELARRLVWRGEYQQAAGAYRAALDADPQDLETLIELGDLLLGPGNRPAEGRAMLEAALPRIPPDRPDLANGVRQRLRRAR